MSECETHVATDSSWLVTDLQSTSRSEHREDLHEVLPQSNAWCFRAKSVTYHPCGSRLYPPCAPLSQTQPGPPGWWPLSLSGCHAWSRRCMVSAWCPVERSLSSHRSRRCSIWLHSFPPWRWLWQISGLHGKRKSMHCVLPAVIAYITAFSVLSSQIKPISNDVDKVHWNCIEK